MSYIDQQLSTGEQIIHRAFVSSTYVLLRPLLPLIIGIPIGWVIGNDTGDANSGAMVAGLFALVLFSGPMLIGGLLTKATTEAALTNRRVILKSGFLGRNTIETYLDKIEGLDVEQSILGRLLGYGSISVRGTGGKGTPCPGISKPQAFHRAVNEQIGRGSRAAGFMH